MIQSTPYEVRLTSAAVKQLNSLDSANRERVTTALRKCAADLGIPSGSRGGKSLKQIRGRRDRFFRLRVGPLRVMFDVDPGRRLLLVLGIVDRAQLERWLRQR